jgi:cell division protein FtsA
VEEGRNPAYRVLGVGQSRSGGIRRDVVTDLEETTESVRGAMKEAELMAGVRADRVFAGIAGNHIDANISTGVVAVGGGRDRGGGRGAGARGGPGRGGPERP